MERTEELPGGERAENEAKVNSVSYSRDESESRSVTGDRARASASRRRVGSVARWSLLHRGKFCADPGDQEIKKLEKKAVWGFSTVGSSTRCVDDVVIRDDPLKMK